MKKNLLLGVTTGLFILFVAGITEATPIIPDSSDWSVTVTTITNRGSGAPNTSITNLAGDDGVLLHYDAPTGGLNIGTSMRQYDYTTTASATGMLNLSFDVEFNAFTGWFISELALHVLQNGVEVQTLFPFTSNAPSSISQTFDDVLLNLSVGDTWGIRAVAGNFTECCGVSGNIEVSADPIPEPATMLLLGTGLVGVAGFARRKKKNQA